MHWTACGLSSNTKRPTRDESARQELLVRKANVPYMQILQHFTVNAFLARKKHLLLRLSMKGVNAVSQTENLKHRSWYPAFRTSPIWHIAPKVSRAWVYWSDRGRHRSFLTANNGSGETIFTNSTILLLVRVSQPLDRSSRNPSLFASR